MSHAKAKLFLASTISLLVLSACNADDKQTQKLEAAATVNGKTISKLSVDLIAKQSAAAGHADSPEARKAIIEQLAMQWLVAEEAVKKGLDKTPEFNEQVEVIKQSTLANAYVQDYFKNNPVSDSVAKAEYDKLAAESAGNEYKARHILVATEAEAKDVIAKLKKDPAAFEALAKEKSMDPGSKVNGGDLGWFDLKTMVPEFGNAVSKLQKGKFSEEPVKSQFGYHIIALDDSRAIQPPPFADVKANIAKQIQQQNLQKQLDELKAKAKIEIVGATPAAKAPAK